MALHYMAEAFGFLADPFAIVVLFLSVLVGLIFGMLPGLTATMAVALLTGLTYKYDGMLAILSLLGVYIGSISGGCQAAILLNIPGTPASAATAVEGHPLAQKGKGGLAIFAANASSFFGTLIAIACLLFLTPLITGIALKFNAQEMFLLSVFGVVICGGLASNGNALKGWISGFCGLFVAMIGRDVIDSVARFTFGSINLSAGISLLPVMIGLFGIPEIVEAFNYKERKIVPMSKFKIKEGFSVIWKNKFNILRSGLLGMTMGAIPGVGEDTGGWLSYWAAKTFSKDKESWGKGNLEGVCASEAGNNGAVAGAIIPVLSLAVPGSAPAAVLLAAFWMHGYRPGPLLMKETPEFLYYVVIFMVIASIIMWIQAFFVSKVSVRILQIDPRILMPIIFVCCVVGSFVVNNRIFDCKVMLVFGVIGIIMRKLSFPAAPFLLGVVLGNMMDSNLRRALILTEGSLQSFFTRPISLFFIVFILLLIIPQIPACNRALKALGSKMLKKRG